MNRNAITACQFGRVSYITIKTGAEALSDNRALGQSPESDSSVSCPDMEIAVPVGACLFNQTTNKRHDHPGHNSGQDIEQELLHKATSFTEDCPTKFIAHGIAQFNTRNSVGFSVRFAKKQKRPLLEQEPNNNTNFRGKTMNHAAAEIKKNYCPWWVL